MKQVKALFPILTFLLLMSWQQTTKAEDIAPNDDIKTGQVYLVKAKDESKSCYEFDNVLVNTMAPTSQTIGNGIKLQGSYHHILTTQAVWQLQEDGKTLHRLNAPVDQKGFSGNIKE